MPDERQPHGLDGSYAQGDHGEALGSQPGRPERPEDILELYKFAVEMADRVSGRRATSNSFFLAVNSALMVLIGILHGGTPDGRPPLSQDMFGVLLLALVGVVLSATWWLLLRSYRDLSRAKWNVIARVEDRLDIRLFQDEWKILKAEMPQTWRRRYRELGLVERVIPLLFLAVYIAFAVRVLIR